ncbi:MAG: hypothetical protein WBE74_15465, partial [Terracidiphilus sp.]
MKFPAFALRSATVFTAPTLLPARNSARAACFRTAAPPVLALTFLLLLWFAMGAFPAWAQTSPSGVAADKTPDPCANGREFATTDCAFSWHGITLYGAYDAGVGWVSHGLPENGYNYEGESLVNRNGYEHRFLVAPNNLQQTGLGIRGKEEFAHGWSVVFNASSGINPQSGLLANASETDIINNGLPRASYS